jgi:hypothetical protein
MFLSVLFNEVVINRHPVLGEMVLMWDSQSAWRQNSPRDSFFKDKYKIKFLSPCSS